MDDWRACDIGIYQAKDEDELREMLGIDPANGLFQVEVLPIARAVVGKPNDRTYKTYLII